MKKISRMGVLSCAKVCGIVYAIFGLVFGLIITGIALAVPASANVPSGFLAGVFGIGSVIVLPLLYGVLGFIGGIIFAAVYNLAAKWTGGMEIALTD